MIDVAQRAMAHVERLCLDIGPRPAGSPGNQAAAGYVAQVFREAGLAVERQGFDCTGWEHEGTVLERGGRRLEAEANWRSLPCDVTADLAPVGTVAGLARADLAGRVAVLYGALTREELMPRTSSVYYPEEHRRINDLLEEKRPAAVITVSPVARAIRHVIKDPEMPIPSATVPPEVGLQLVRHAGEPVRLRIAATRSAGRSWNVIGTRPGAGAGRIVICAHYDTVWGTPGAYDNASGTGVMLTLAELLAGWQVDCGLEFVAFSAEEFGGEGDPAYLAPYGLQEIPARWGQTVGEHSEVWRPILAAINADGVGFELGANTITAIAASQGFQGLVGGIQSDRWPDLVPVGPWPASNHYMFYSHGVPSIALGSTGGVNDVVHHAGDTIEWLSPARLGEAVSVEADLVQALQSKTPEWCRPAE